MPLLTDVTLPDKAFRWREKVTLNSRKSSSLSDIDIGCLQSCFARFICNSDKEWEALSPSSVESIIVPDYSCFSMGLQLDLSSFVKLKQFAIGYNCRLGFSELKVSGLPALESFKCGYQSLTGCTRVVFESGSFLFRVMNRLASFGLHSIGFQLW